MYFCTSFSTAEHQLSQKLFQNSIRSASQKLYQSCFIKIISELFLKNCYQTLIILSTTVLRTAYSKTASTLAPNCPLINFFQTVWYSSARIKISGPKNSAYLFISTPTITIFSRICSSTNVTPIIVTDRQTLSQVSNFNPLVSTIIAHLTSVPPGRPQNLPRGDFVVSPFGNSLLADAL